MQRVALALALIASAAVHGQKPADPMATAECAAARQQLDQALAAAVPRDRLDVARRQAARVCLGKRPPAAATAPSGRFVPPPVAVTPIPVPASPAVPPLPALPPRALPRAPVITICDPAGCWDSNGQRYELQGPVLVGPRGVCTLQGGLLNCP